MATKTCGKCGSDIPLPGPCPVCNDRPFGGPAADLSRMTLAELGRHVVTLPGWRWLGGARWRIPGTDLSGRVRGLPIDPDAIPDLADSATIGGLQALVREAWGDKGLHVRPSPRSEHFATSWRVYSSGGSGWGVWYPTEAHALVAALEAAP